MNRKLMYKYFNLPSIILDAVYDAITDKTIKMIFEKKWSSEKITLTDKEEEMFEDAILRFEKILKYIISRYSHGYTLEETINSLKEHKPLPLKLMIGTVGKKQLLDRYKISQDKFNEILGSLPNNLRYCFNHYYGFGEPRFPTYEIADKLKITTDEVKQKLIYIDSYIFIKSYSELDGIAKNKVLYVIENGKLNIILEQKKEIKEIEEVKPEPERIKAETTKDSNDDKKGSRNKRKESFFDYFDEEDREDIKQIISEKKNVKGFEILIKLYGENYDKLNHDVKLEQIQTGYLESLKIAIKRELEKRKNVDNTNSKRLRKESFYDYFSEEDKEEVKKIIDEKFNTKGLEILIKLYGENYDKLNHDANLSQLEVSNLETLKSRIKKDLVLRKNSTSKIPEENKIGKKTSPRKTKKIAPKGSFLEHFEEFHRPFVKKLLDNLKQQKDSKMKILVKLYGEEYDNLSEEIKLTAEERSELRKLKADINRQIEQRVLTAPKYGSEDEILNKYKLNHKKLSSYLDTLDNVQSLCFCYYYGINRPKKNVVEISNLLNITPKKIIEYVVRTDDSLEITKKEKTKPKGKVRKTSFFDYFAEEDRQNINPMLDKLKEQNSPWIKALIKLYGDDYSTLNSKVELDNEEKKQISRLIRYIKNKLKKSNNDENLNNKNSIKKKNFYENFEEEDREIVKQILEDLKNKNSSRLNVLTKLYGKDYTELNFEAKLDKKESSRLYNLIYYLNKKLIEIKENGQMTNIGTKTKKSNFYDYFEVDDRAIVKQLLQELKNKNSPRLDVLTKLYGEDYTELNTDVKLDNNENARLYNLIRYLNDKLTKIKEGNQMVTVGIKTKKTSFYDNFEEKDREIVKQILADLKSKNSSRLNILTKLYGDDYEELNTEVKLEKNEHQCIYNLVYQIKQQLLKPKKASIAEKPKSKERNKSFYENFEEKDRDIVKETLENLRKQGSVRVKTLIKLYGEDYSKLDDSIILNKKEQGQISSLMQSIRTEIKMKSYQPKIEVKPGENNIENLEAENSVDSEKSKFEQMAENYNINELSGIELLIIKSILDGKSVDRISKLLGITNKQIDYYLLKNLELFDEDIPDILTGIIKRRNFKIDKIIKCSYLGEQMLNLSELEKMYIHLKLQSLINKNLTDEVIRQMLSLNEEDLKEYEIMTKSDSFNQLNKIIKLSL